MSYPTITSHKIDIVVKVFLVFQTIYSLTGKARILRCFSTLSNDPDPVRQVNSGGISKDYSTVLGKILGCRMYVTGNRIDRLCPGTICAPSACGGNVGQFFTTDF